MTFTKEALRNFGLMAKPNQYIELKPGQAMMIVDLIDENERLRAELAQARQTIEDVCCGAKG